MSDSGTETPYRAPDASQPDLEGKERSEARRVRRSRIFRHIAILGLILAIVLPCLSVALRESPPEPCLTKADIPPRIRLLTDRAEFEAHAAKLQSASRYVQAWNWGMLLCAAYCNIGPRGEPDCDSYRSVYCHVPPHLQRHICR